MMKNGIISFNDADILLKQFAEKLNVTAKNVKSVIPEINEKISDHLFRIDTQICEITGSKMCVFVNTTVDDISKSSYSPGELELFDNILSNIMTSDSKCVSAIACLNLSSRLKSHMTKDFAQNKINLWCQNGYLVKQDGIIYLGARCITEFEIYLKNQYSERITVCKLCKDTVYFGKVCAHCSEVIHIHCLSKYVNKNNKCPVCKEQWREEKEHSFETNDQDDLDDSS